jgi:hypothetical protein
MLAEAPSVVSVPYLMSAILSHNWQKTCFDLWEETQGHHFYTRIFAARRFAALASWACESSRVRPRSPGCRTGPTPPPDRGSVRPVAGQVVTWDVRNTLIHRPVERGQMLLSVADVDGAWELEIRMPEERMGHIAHAQAEAGPWQKLTVSFILATEPGVTYQGTLEEVHQRAEVRGEEGNVVLLRVAVDKFQLSQLRRGATVLARVHCGPVQRGSFSRGLVRKCTTTAYSCEPLTSVLSASSSAAGWDWRLMPEDGCHSLRQRSSGYQLMTSDQSRETIVPWSQWHTRDAATAARPSSPPALVPASFLGTAQPNPLSSAAPQSWVRR